MREERGLLKELVWRGGPIRSASARFCYSDLDDTARIERFADANFTQNAGESAIAFERGLEDNGIMPKVYAANGREEFMEGLTLTEVNGPLGMEPELMDAVQAATMPFERTTSVTHKNGLGASVSDSAYIYDKGARLDFANEDGETIDYTHDLTSQLTGATRSVLPSENYDYDDAGNRETANGETYQVIAHNRYESAGDWIFQYDLEGNMIRKTSASAGDYWVYDFDHRNRITRATQRDSGGAAIQTVDFTYDVFDRRIAKEVQGGERTVMFYEGEDVWKDEIRETPSSDAKTVYYLRSGIIDQHIARQTVSAEPPTDSQIVWYLTDRMGSVIGHADAEGNVLNRQRYSSFGVIAQQSSPEIADRYAFTGREWDGETGLYYFRARYYCSNLGKFLSEDPIGLESLSGVHALSLKRWTLGHSMNVKTHDYHSCRYVVNAPTDSIDPMGYNSTDEYFIVVDTEAGIVEVYLISESYEFAILVESEAYLGPALGKLLSGAIRFMFEFITHSFYVY